MVTNRWRSPVSRIVLVTRACIRDVEFHFSPFIHCLTHSPSCSKLCQRRKNCAWARCPHARRNTCTWVTPDPATNSPFHIDQVYVIVIAISSALVARQIYSARHIVDTSTRGKGCERGTHCVAMWHSLFGGGAPLTLWLVVWLARSFQFHGARLVSVAPPASTAT